MQGPGENKLNIRKIIQVVIGNLVEVNRILKPGGIFVSSTFCGGDTHRWLRFVLPIGRFFGRLPHVDLFTRRELTESIQRAGFTIDREWQPSQGKAVFIVAKKT